MFKLDISLIFLNNSGTIGFLSLFHPEYLTVGLLKSKTTNTFRNHMRNNRLYVEYNKYRS